MMRAVFVALGINLLMAGCGRDAPKGGEAFPDASIANAAKTAAVAWLAVVDEGRYEESWDAASRLFRLNMAKFGKDSVFWAKALRQSRSPLGAVVSRELSSTSERHPVPGATAGMMSITLTFASSFENQDAVTETLDMTEDDDRSWRVLNYLIRREQS